MPSVWRQNSSLLLLSLPFFQRFSKYSSVLLLTEVQNLARPHIGFLFALPEAQPFRNSFLDSNDYTIFAHVQVYADLCMPMYGQPVASSLIACYTSQPTYTSYTIDMYTHTHCTVTIKDAILVVRLLWAAFLRCLDLYYLIGFSLQQLYGHFILYSTLFNSAPSPFA